MDKVKHIFKNILLPILLFIGFGYYTYIQLHGIRYCEYKGTPGAHSTYDQVVIQSEPLLLSGNDVLIIEDTEYILTSTLEVRDNAQVIVKNSRIVHHVGHLSENHLLLRDNATMEMENVVIDANGWITWGVYDFATLKQTDVRHTDIDLWLNISDHGTGIFRNTMFRGTIGGYGKLDIDHSPYFTHVEFVYPAGSVVNEDLTDMNNYVEEYHFPNEDDKYIPFQVDVVDSRMERWSFTGSPNSYLTIRGAKNINMTFGSIPGQVYEYHDLEAKHYDDSTWIVGSGVTRLIDTSVHGWSPVAGENNTLIIRNGLLSDIQYSSHNAQIYIYDSDVAMLVASDDVYMYIEDSIVDFDVKAEENGLIELKNVDVRGDIVEEGNGRVVILD